MEGKGRIEGILGKKISEERVTSPKTSKYGIN